MVRLNSHLAQKHGIQIVCRIFAVMLSTDIGCLKRGGSINTSWHSPLRGLNWLQKDGLKLYRSHNELLDTQGYSNGGDASTKSGRRVRVLGSITVYSLTRPRILQSPGQLIHIIFQSGQFGSGRW